MGRGHLRSDGPARRGQACAGRADPGPLRPRIIEEPECLIARRELDARIADDEEVLARQPRSRFLIDLPTSEKKLREAWEDRWTLNEQHRVVRMALRGLVISPPKRGLPRFDPNRLDPDWRV